MMSAAIAPMRNSAPSQPPSRLAGGDGGAVGSLSASSGLEWASDRVKPEGKVSWWVRNMHALDIDGTGAYAEMERNIVHPNSAFMASWTVAMLVSIMACLIYIPFQMAFEFEPKFGASLSQGFWAFSLPVMDLYFCFDIVLNFHLAYYDDGDLIQDKRKIMRRYMMGWGPIDMMALVPSLLDLVALLSGDSSGGGGAINALRSFRILRLARLLKLMRLLKLGKMMQMLEELSEEMKVIIRVLKVVLATISISHVFACILHMIGTSGGANNWIDAYHGGIESWRDETMQANYLTALYYAFVTVTTVGYGDILPVNDTERGFSIVMMFFGTAVFAFILGEMQSLVNKRRSTEVEFSHKMESVAEFMDYKRFPSYLRKSVRQFYNTIWKSNVVFDERAILLDLSPELRHEVAMFLKGHLISKVPFLRSASDAVVSSLVHRLHPEVVGKGDTIIRAGEAADCMFIIDTGEVVSKRLTGNPRKEQKTLMHDGMFFGELALLKEGTKRFETVRATRTTELMILSKKDLDLVLKEHPEAKDLLAEFNVRRPSFDEHEVTEEDLFKLADTDGDGTCLPRGLPCPMPGRALCVRAVCAVCAVLVMCLCVLVCARACYAPFVLNAAASH